jgi:hypothetical protein
MSGNERRSSRRTKKQVVFQFAAIGEDGRRAGPAHGLLLDYSFAGIRFVTAEQLGKNTALHIELEFAGLGKDGEEWRSAWGAGEEERLAVIGSVMWCQEAADRTGQFEVGTRFIEKAAADTLTAA